MCAKEVALSIMWTSLKNKGLTDVVVVLQLLIVNVELIQKEGKQVEAGDRTILAKHEISFPKQETWHVSYNSVSLLSNYITLTRTTYSVRRSSVYTNT